MVVLGVSGYRNFTNYEQFRNCLSEIQDVEMIVTGGCKGTDALAERYAQEHNIPITVIPADWSLGKRAGPMRNAEIVRSSDMLVAFLHPNSKGTRDVITKAKQMKKTCVVVNILAPT